MTTTGEDIAADHPRANLEARRLAAGVDELLKLADQAIGRSQSYGLGDLPERRAAVLALAMVVAEADDRTEAIRNFASHITPLLVTSFEQQKALRARLLGHDATVLINGLFGATEIEQRSERPLSRRDSRLRRDGQQATSESRDKPLETPSVPKTGKRPARTASASPFVRLWWIIAKWLTGFGQRKRSARLLRRKISSLADNFSLTLPAVSSATEAGVSRKGAIEASKRGVRRTRTIDVARSVKRTLARGGTFAPVFRSRSTPTKYLVLSRQISTRDLEHERIRALVRQLRAQGVQISFYAYLNDPRDVVESRDGQTQRGVSLGELFQRHPDARLVLATEGHELLNPLTLAPLDWVESLKIWARRAIVTPLPSGGWGRAERTLHRALGFSVSSTYENALDNLGTILGGNGPVLARASGATDAAPLLVSSSDLDYVMDCPPDEAEKGILIADLREFLGPSGFLWLAACSYFPVMLPPLALHFGSALRGHGLDPRDLDQVYARLAGLPWMRHGHMPYWVRRLVTQSLDDEGRRIAREAAVSVFVGEPPSLHSGGVSPPWVSAGGRNSLSLNVRIADGRAAGGLMVDELTIEMLANGADEIDPLIDLSVDELLKEARRREKTRQKQSEAETAARRVRRAAERQRAAERERPADGARAAQLADERKARVASRAKAREAKKKAAPARAGQGKTGTEYVLFPVGEPGPNIRPEQDYFSVAVLAIHMPSRGFNASKVAPLIWSTVSHHDPDGQKKLVGLYPAESSELPEFSRNDRVTVTDQPLTPRTVAREEIGLDLAFGAVREKAFRQGALKRAWDLASSSNFVSQIVTRNRSLPTVDAFADAMNELINDNDVVMLGRMMLTLRSPLRSGVFAFVSRSENTAGLKYDQATHTLANARGPIASPYAVLRLVAEVTRADWMRLPDLIQAWELIRQKSINGDDVVAAIERFRLTALTSPDLTRADAEELTRAAQLKFAHVLAGEAASDESLYDKERSLDHAFGRSIGTDLSTPDASGLDAVSGPVPAYLAPGLSRRALETVLQDEGGVIEHPHDRGGPRNRGEFIFVSHASRDKPLIRFLVEALIEAGIGVWLDNPEGLGFSPDYVRQNFQNLRPGARWLDQIHDALEASKCVLACCTRTYWERYRAGGTLGQEDGGVREEVSKGRGKLVMCRLDGFDISEVPADLSHIQFADLHSSAPDMPFTDDVRNMRIATLIEAVKAMMERTSELHRRSVGWQMSERLLPYLAGRRVQVAAVQRAASGVQQGRVQALTLMAPDNEGLDQFMERLRRVEIPKVTEREWPKLLVRWPMEAGSGEFADAYAWAIASEMRVPVSELEKRLSMTQQYPLIVISVMSIGDWRKTQRQQMLEWLEFWKQMETSRSARVLTMLAIEWPWVAPSRARIPAVRRGGVSTKRVWTDVGAVEQEANAKPDTYASLTRLSVLGPISEAEAREWSRQVTANAKPEVVATIGVAIKEIFASPSAARTGVDSETFASAIDPVLRKLGLHRGA